MLDYDLITQDAPLEYQVWKEICMEELYGFIFLFWCHLISFVINIHHELGDANCYYTLFPF